MWFLTIISYLQSLFGFFAFFMKFLKKGSFIHKLIVIIIIILSINSYGIYFLIKKYQTTPSKFEETLNDNLVNNKIRETLKKCGDLSYISWAVLEKENNPHGKYLLFKTINGCDRDLTRFREDKKNCVVDIMFHNPIYYKKHFINQETLKFIESDPILPNGAQFIELIPIHFTLLDENGKDTKEAEFLKNNAGEFWNIINRTNLRLAEIIIIKVRYINEFGKPVIYLFTFSFLPNAEKSCVAAGGELMKIARKSLKTL